MDDEQQDAVLHILGLLTRFPPAIRAAYILMRGEPPRSSERAALAQSLYEVLKAVVPLRVISSSPLRFFEGSQLLFGLILEKAKNLKINKALDDSSPSYVGMSVYDLRNMITVDPALSTPVQTKAGLLDIGFYKAFEEGVSLNGPITTTPQRLLSWTVHEVVWLYFQVARIFAL
jgi:hypothetical protein